LIMGEREEAADTEYGFLFLLDPEKK